MDVIGNDELPTGPPAERIALNEFLREYAARFVRENESVDSAFVSDAEDEELELGTWDDPPFLTMLWEALPWARIPSSRR